MSVSALCWRISRPSVSTRRTMPSPSTPRVKTATRTASILSPRAMSISRAARLLRPRRSRPRTIHTSARTLQSVKKASRRVSVLPVWAARFISAPIAMPTTMARSLSPMARRTASPSCRAPTASASTPMQSRPTVITTRPTASMQPSAAQKQAMVLRQRTIPSTTTRTLRLLISTAPPIQTVPVCPSTARARRLTS